MSGTSADGIDVAFCRISPATAERQLRKLNVADIGPKSPVNLRRPLHRISPLLSVTPPRVKLLAHTSHPYSAALRKAVLAAMDAHRTSTAELSRLHWHLGRIYAEALEQSLATTKLKPNLIALHGQTIYHQATASPYLGAPTRATWQIGEASILAERLRLPVISDFRPADIAAGGQGAPLVPMLDYTLFRHRTRNRILLNLGGIANLTVIPAGSAIDGVLAFDTGPANMVIDALMHRLYGRTFDKDGATAARGKVLTPVLDKFLANPYLATSPPKSCGREQYGEAFATRFLTACQRLSPRKQAAVATATALTVCTIQDAIARFCLPRLAASGPTDLIVAGGGTRNAHLLHLLREALTSLNIDVTTTEQAAGIPPEAKEAAAFALLGWLTWHHLPGNVPSATGASRPVILGKVTYA